MYDLCIQYVQNDTKNKKIYNIYNILQKIKLCTCRIRKRPFIELLGVRYNQETMGELYMSYRHIYIYV